MNSKVERALYGPSWTEIFLGAVLSLIVGAVLAAVYLVLQPVQVVRELPKEPAPNAVYYVEGSKDSSRGRQWLRKRQMLTEGNSITLTEEELNTAIAMATEKEKPGAADALLAPGAPNFRIRDGQLQIGVPCTINLFGLNRPLMVFARGNFEKQGDVFVFAPEVFYVGSCPIQRLPIVPNFVRGKIVAAQGLPEELVAAWRNLSNVSVEENTLQLTM